MKIQNNKSVRWSIFLIPWALTIVVVIINFTNGDLFNLLIMRATNFILDDFSWAFSLSTFICVVLIIIAYISPFGNVRIGGRDAKAELPMANYVWIVLCTVMAAGILLWACAEPMYHYYMPPSHIEAQSPQAIQFLMKNIFLEWTFTPMCIYCLPAILFAFSFYNMGEKYSFGSMLYPALNKKTTIKLLPFIDGVCLFSLVCGMAASMGSAVFLLTDGISWMSDSIIANNTELLIIISAIIVTAFVTSAMTGVMKGIKMLSTFNSRIYMTLGLFVLIFGPTTYILNMIVESFGAYLSDFCQMSLFISTIDGDKWAMWWPIFFWCNWLAWMPITATFLGRISKGFTTRQIIRAIVLYPSLFSVFWLGLFSSSSIFFELQGANINAAMIENGTAYATYKMLEQLPFSKITIFIFLLIVLISFITAADSNTNAMSGLCTNGLTKDDQESPKWLKIVWGITIGGICCVFLVAFNSTDALKYLSNLGGFPILFIIIIIIISFIKVISNPYKYDKNKDDYDKAGNPKK